MENVQNQQLTLLARKALLQDELKQIENALGQLAAIAQFIEASKPKDVDPSELKKPSEQ
jgi:Asp-tRNA(Asn)/Glu-tRNA(Gln) amidotransferase C subunit